MSSELRIETGFVMKSYEAIQRAIAGNTIHHAKELHLSTSMVSKWQEPTTDFTDSGAYNPLDRVETIIETSLKLGTTRPEALAPIQYLARRFNCALVPLPEIPPSLENLQIELSATVKEFGQLMSVSGEALEDHIITPAESRRIDVAGERLNHYLNCFLSVVRKASKHG